MIKIIKRFITPHYLIIGYYSKTAIGCCCGKNGKADILSEEPNASFKKVASWKCPFCNKSKNKIKEKE